MILALGMGMGFDNSNAFFFLGLNGKVGSSPKKRQKTYGHIKMSQLQKPLLSYIHSLFMVFHLLLVFGPRMIMRVGCIRLFFLGRQNRMNYILYV